MSAKRVLIINGPNLNLLGKRDPEVYGTKSFEDYFVELKNDFPEIELSYEQSNLEGEIINLIQGSDHDAIILNAGGYSHTSVAIRDAVEAADVAVVEVHISNISGRESFRHDSLISPVSAGCIFGFGLKGYAVALQGIKLL
ncbi:3-dehydroquinate dehydratase [Paracrocinitomix mangrovi]|uniref:type II 3-dehydroquinate dehydratase n=1 Tax=Paracrocinitomix mangrovi TaxID=2862509 RepID=UPI001C8D8A31|nr:type II 3-dehydroquinate dehydratase [Paracrocinitomix mangrovi]UKN01748.1 3-dehydroquinate dehydratase [Paracrocinitomix mangrovi]